MELVISTKCASRTVVGKNAFGISSCAPKAASISERLTAEARRSHSTRRTGAAKADPEHAAQQLEGRAGAVSTGFRLGILRVEK